MSSSGKLRDVTMSLDDAHVVITRGTLAGVIEVLNTHGNGRFSTVLRLMQKVLWDGCPQAPILNRAFQDHRNLPGLLHHQNAEHHLANSTMSGGNQQEAMGLTPYMETSMKFFDEKLTVDLSTCAPVLKHHETPPEPMKLFVAASTSGNWCEPDLEIPKTVTGIIEFLRNTWGITRVAALSAAQTAAFGQTIIFTDLLESLLKDDPENMASNVMVSGNHPTAAMKKLYIALNQQFEDGNIHTLAYLRMQQK